MCVSLEQVDCESSLRDWTRDGAFLEMWSSDFTPERVDDLLVLLFAKELAPRT
jgi:hypothetical protein